MYWCNIREKNKITSPWKSEHRFKSSVSDSLHLSVVWIWICACLKAVLRICPCVCVCLCLFLTTGCALLSLNSTKSITWRKDEGYFTEIFMSFTMGLSHWLHLTTTDPSNKYYKHHCLWTNNQILRSALSTTFMVDIHFIRFPPTSTFAAFSTHALPGSRAGKRT